MPDKSASTSSATRSDLTGTKRTANGIWAQARPRGACNGSRQRSVICWRTATTTPGRPCPDVRDALNAFLFGWSRYFSYGTHRAVFRGIDYYVYERVRDFLARRHKVPRRGTRRFSYEVIYGARGVPPLDRAPLTGAPCASRW